MKTIIGICTLLLSASIFAGPRVRNGGGAWQCIENDKTSWIQIVDLYEAEHEFKLELQSFSSNSYFEIVDDIRQKLIEADFYFSHGFDRHLDLVLELIEFVEKVELPIIHDANFRIVPDKDSCPNGEIQYAQVANFTSENKLFIQKEYWGLLSETEKAALIYHEAFYSLFRQITQDHYSDRAREVVGLVFSNLSAARLNQELLNIYNSKNYSR